MSWQSFWCTSFTCLSSSVKGVDAIFWRRRHVSSGRRLSWSNLWLLKILLYPMTHSDKATSTNIFQHSRDCISFNININTLYWNFKVVYQQLYWLLIFVYQMLGHLWYPHYFKYIHFLYLLIKVSGFWRKQFKSLSVFQDSYILNLINNIY